MTDSKKDGICRQNGTGSLHVNGAHLDKMDIHPSVLQRMLFWGCGVVQGAPSLMLTRSAFFFSSQFPHLPPDSGKHKFWSWSKTGTALSFMALFGAKRFFWGIFDWSLDIPV